MADEKEKLDEQDLENVTGGLDDEDQCREYYEIDPSIPHPWTSGPHEVAPWEIHPLNETVSSD